MSVIFRTLGLASALALGFFSAAMDQVGVVLGPWSEDSITAHVAEIHVEAHNGVAPFARAHDHSLHHR